MQLKHYLKDQLGYIGILILAINGALLVLDLFFGNDGESYSGQTIDFFSLYIAGIMMAIIAARHFNFSLQVNTPRRVLAFELIVGSLIWNALNLMLGQLVAWIEIVLFGLPASTSLIDLWAHGSWVLGMLATWLICAGISLFTLMAMTCWWRFSTKANIIGATLVFAGVFVLGMTIGSTASNPATLNFITFVGNLIGITHTGFHIWPLILTLTALATLWGALSWQILKTTTVQRTKA